MLTIFQSYYLEKRVALKPPILFGIQHSYGTRCPQHFAAFRKSFTKRFSHNQAVNWWNALPPEFILSNLFKSFLIQLNL